MHYGYLMNAIHLILTDGIQSWEKLSYFWPTSCIMFITILLHTGILAHVTLILGVNHRVSLSLILFRGSHSFSIIIISDFSFTYSMTSRLFLNTFYQFYNCNIKIKT